MAMNFTKKKLNNNDIATIVVNEIMAALDQNVLPWNAPWVKSMVFNPPKNLFTGKAYNGVNIWALSAAKHKAGFSSSYWLTYEQAKKLGGHVRANEKSNAHVIWASPRIIPDLDESNKQKTDIDGKPLTKTIFVYAMTAVFNASQCNGLDIPAENTDYLRKDVATIDSCEATISMYRNAPAVIHGNDRACYNSITDVIRMPDRGAFINDSAYYSVLFHEYAHSTGHSTRLNRPLGNPKHSVAYGKEELIAEFAASILCAHSGINYAANTQESINYIQHWKDAINANPNTLLKAANQATLASNYILGIASADYKAE
jgi:antirestriction protein ArdC